MSPENLTQALHYAAHGWPVLPLKVGGKAPATAHGVKDATTDPDTIRVWWQQAPGANVGIAMPPDVFAVDIDVKNGADGFASLAALTAEHGELPETRTVETPSRGWHLYFRKPPALRVKNSTKVRPGIDLRSYGNGSFGGYVAAPPSTIEGEAYRLLNDCEPANAPPWLLDVVTAAGEALAAPLNAQLAPRSAAHDPYANRAMERATSDVLAAGEGSRNHALNAAAYGIARLAGAGRLDWPHAAGLLERAALAAGLAPAEIRQTLESARAAGTVSPNYEGPQPPAQHLPMVLEFAQQGTTESATAEHPLSHIVPPPERLEPPRWLLPGFMAEGITLIAGGQGVGKTTALLPLAAGVAGIHEHGWPLAPKHWREVVYVTEDSAQAWRILHGLAGHLATTVAAITERVHLVDARRLPAAYLVQVGATYRERYSRNADGVALPPLVVLDTQAATIELESENDNSEASAAVAALKQHFASLSVWIVAHLAKANINRADVASLSARGAGAWEGDAHCTAFLVKEERGQEASRWQTATRWLVLGKKRFEPRWPEMQLESHTAEVIGYDQWGDPEPVTLRWATAQPQEGGRQEHMEQVRQEQQRDDEAALRQEIRDAVQTAWQEGHPLNRAGVKAKVRRKAADVVACIERLLAESWLQEIHVPRSERKHPSRADFLVNLDTPEREAARRGEALPLAKSAIPESWKKANPPVPEKSEDATKDVAASADS